MDFERVSKNNSRSLRPKQNLLEPRKKILLRNNSGAVCVKLKSSLFRGTARWYNKGDFTIRIRTLKDNSPLGIEFRGSSNEMESTEDYCVEKRKKGDTGHLISRLNFSQN